MRLAAASRTRTRRPQTRRTRTRRAAGSAWRDRPGKAAIRNSWSPSGQAVRHLRAGCAGRRAAARRPCASLPRVPAPIRSGRSCPSRSLSKRSTSCAWSCFHSASSGGVSACMSALGRGAVRAELAEQRRRVPARRCAPRSSGIRAPASAAVRRPAARVGQGVSPYHVVDSLGMTSAPSGCTMHSPVPSSSRNGCDERPEVTVRHDWRACRSVPIAPSAGSGSATRRTAAASAGARFFVPASGLPRPVELDVALRRGADARSRRVLDQSRDVQRAQREPAAARDGDAERQHPEPEVDASPKQLAQVHVALLFLRELEQRRRLKSNIRATTRSGKVWMRMLFRLTASL